ncbi:glycosyltransferase family 2 protein [Ktedonosporobacter rubrisoli]|uniref:Glycosyltransferase family 2 protein n=1 Tax=Ktedonosporobacter rubrisoli TaxID=2509675 RepID=A0A4V0YZ34_KTERU|nr:glycosyltransferase family A protein [Ktedonosporobacter rubrisoli]QBD78331.1 glycosyltransferase family 2 protein [Ktedonosporobacter rubrisoli]
MARIDVLIPTYRRKTGLAIVLTSLLGQTFADFNVVISDQTEEENCYLDSIEIQTLVRALRWHGHKVALHRHLPPRGMAEQRHFLLEQSAAPYVHFIDDDVLLDPSVLQRMLTVLETESCGFVGCPATGLHLLQDVRPQQQHIELWNGPVRPEPFKASSIPWERHLVNNAANPLHLEQRLVEPGQVLRYKIAWVGGANVLFDRAKLLSVGGFSWWQRLPREHAGEEVVVQFLLIRKYGGCGILPSGTYHLGLPTNVENRERNATELFAELCEELDCRPVEDEQAREYASSHSTTPR